ncbi:MAG: UDP-N-acetylmuramate--L-alanine ligase, partial [Chloroflexi bacterium]|nr:UDP-N-acetylmuramate--L-alanine ligase [Chloroflexota bacterium]
LDGTRLLAREKVKHVHFIGIGGIGLSAIARVLHEDGYRISGSDMQQTALTAELATLGMEIYYGHRPEHVAGADLVVVSSAVPEGNVELVAAREAGIPVVKRAELLGEMMAGRFGIAVAGTHGKTTTTAFISFLLTRMGLDPTFIVGGILEDLGTNARRGMGPYFVIEADEYDYMFLGLRPRLSVVTVIEMDHPDCFADIEDMTQAFYQFMCLLPDSGTLIGCADQPRVVQLLQRVGQERAIDLITYGLREGAWQAQEIHSNQLGGSDFDVLHGGQVVGRASLRLPGLHNVSNALAVLAVMDRLGLDIDKVLPWLPQFRGVRRRFEIKGEAKDIIVIDDYAHHPTEIRATLAAARRRFGNRRLWVFFQPHTYSRTKALLEEFAASFGDADHVLISEIYAARETNSLGTSARDLVQLMHHPDVHYVPTLHEASAYLQTVLQPGDVLLTLGAGDGYLVGETILRVLSENEREKQWELRN